MRDMRIRFARVSDAPELLAIYAPYVTDTAVTFEYAVPSVEEFAGRIRSTLERYPYIVAEYDGVIVGYTYASPFRVRAAYAWSVECSIYVRRDMKKRGVGRLLYEALEINLAKQNITNMYACIAVPHGFDEHLNRDSVEFHSHMGFRMIGEFEKCAYKFDHWYDMAMMEKQIGPRRVPQPPVIPFPDAREELY